MSVSLIALLLAVAGIILVIMYVGFAAGLTVAVFASGLFALVDIVFFRKKRLKQGNKDPILIEYARSFFPVLLLVWIIRSFIIQPYRVPTGSLEPTVMPGEFLVVNQFAYGLKFPIGNVKLIATGEPKHGDIVLFWPPIAHAAHIYVKRLIGEPGDHIVYRNKILYINGKEQKQRFLGKDYDYGNGPGQIAPVAVYEEDFEGHKHKIFRHPDALDGYPHAPMADAEGNFEYTVPAGHYFMMGDNRDESADSRYFGAVPERNIIGKAFAVWMSWDPVHHRIRWDRIGTSLLKRTQSFTAGKQETDR